MGGLDELQLGLRVPHVALHELAVAEADHGIRGGALQLHRLLVRLHGQPPLAHHPVLPAQLRLTTGLTLNSTILRDTQLTHERFARAVGSNGAVHHDLRLLDDGQLAATLQ